MNRRSCFVVVQALVLVLCGAVAAAKMAFVPLATGALGNVNSKDGDSGFVAEYFAGGEAAGAPAVTRLEPSVNGEKPPTSQLQRSASVARYTGTVTPKQSGSFPISLRSTGAATLKIDGQTVMERAAKESSPRSVATVAMQKGKPYELVVELRNPSGQARVWLEWAAPSPVAAADAKPADAGEAAAGPTPGAKIGPAARLENQLYALASSPDGLLVLTEKATGAAATFQPEFVVVFQPKGSETKLDPKGVRFEDDGVVGNTNYLVPTWEKESDFLVAAKPRTRLRAESATGQGRTIKWSFPKQEGYALTAEISLPEGGDAGAAEPVLKLRLTPSAAGQYSVGFVGAPKVSRAAAEWVWQPLVWQDRRFPNKSYLTKEFQCPIPSVMVGTNGTAVGVAADPAEMPYRMPTNADSRFGIVLRNAAGEMQPMLFAPVLGGPESAMEPGKAYEFTMRLFVRKGGWYGAYTHLARGLYRFDDVRENGLCSLNTTIENMVDFILTDEYSYWYPRYKTWGYQNDAGPDAGRQQSAADALGIALVCDHPDFLRLRAVPTLEYMLSRNASGTKFDKPTFMGGGIASTPTDLTAAYRLTGGRSTAIREILEKGAGKRLRTDGPDSIGRLKNQLVADLTQYRLSGDAAHLKAACATADRYIALRIDKPAETFGDAGSSFWTELGPSYDVLYELYEETGERKYLDAAAAAMRQFTAYTYLVPVIPDGPFVANPGGIYNKQPVSEETVPAWRVSANGLAAECAGTAHSHRGVFMVSYAGYMARIARDTGDTFLLDVARNAIVGRYANYPSYAYRNGYSTVYEKPDYPLKTFEQIKKFTSAHYNHPLPMTAFLIDYLVSETYYRSGGEIRFPSDYTHTGAYFRNKVYGARPGSFYDEKGVYLWLPKGLLTSDSIQVNWVAGHGNGKLYLALANQSKRPVTTTIQLDPARVEVAGARDCRVWIDNAPASPIRMTDGKATVSIAAKGLTCLAIDGVAVTTRIQQAVLDPSSPPLPKGSSQTVSGTFGEVTATALRFGKDLTSVHVWLKAGPDRVKRATLAYTLGGEQHREACGRFPFEWTVPVPDSARELEFMVEAEGSDGGSTRAPVLSVDLAGQR